METPIQDLFGRKAPRAMLAELRNGKVAALNAADLLGKGHVLVMWMPGAFTPVSSAQNIIGLIANAVRLRQSGVDDIVCIAASDPFAVDVWSKSVDPAGRVRFVSDVGLEFARALGLIASEHYMMTLREGVIETWRMEQRPTGHGRALQEAFVLDV
jgi:peroxiredoxin